MGSGDNSWVPRGDSSDCRLSVTSQGSRDPGCAGAASESGKSGVASVAVTPDPKRGSNCVHACIHIAECHAYHMG